MCKARLVEGAVLQGFLDQVMPWTGSHIVQQEMGASGIDGQEAKLDDFPDPDILGATL